MERHLQTTLFMTMMQFYIMPNQALSPSIGSIFNILMNISIRDLGMMMEMGLAYIENRE